MRSRAVCDASAVAALLLDAGRDGRWVTDVLHDVELAAPALFPFETANIVRRLELAGSITSDQATQAHADLLDLTVELWPYGLLARRAWQLRRNLTAYDASYVALAEDLEIPLVTLDRKIGGAPGLRCEVLSP